MKHVRVRKKCSAIALVAAVCLASVDARASDDDTKEASAQVEPTPPVAAPGPAPPPSTPAPSTATTTPASTPEPVPERTTFHSDPIADGAILLGALGFAGMLGLINSTGEVRPQQISPTFERSQLLGIDRGAISQVVDPNARTFSNIGLFAAGAFAAIDPILSGLREKNVQAGLVDAVLYGESIALTWAVTDLAKIAVRRPRPQAYIDAEAHKGDPNYSNADTDSALSFFSGHASITATIASTATYLAFARSRGGPRPWITAVVGAAVTSFVAIERVRAGAHFPTDVIAGAIAGAGIGVIVPHLHRTEDVKSRTIWVGYGPVTGNGGALQLGGLF